LLQADPWLATTRHTKPTKSGAFARPWPLPLAIQILPSPQPMGLGTPIHYRGYQLSQERHLGWTVEPLAA